MYVIDPVPRQSYAVSLVTIVCTYLLYSTNSDVIASRRIRTSCKPKQAIDQTDDDTRTHTHSHTLTHMATLGYVPQTDDPS